MIYKEELFRTPDILRRVLRESTDSLLGDAKRLLFVGCGTSRYIGAQLERLCRAVGREAAALDAVEVLEHPAEKSGGEVAVYISRSGRSRETVLAAEELRRRGVAGFYLGCTPASPLDTLCDSARVIPWAEETLVLESFSYYAQLLLGAVCCGLPVGGDIPPLVSDALSRGEEAGRAIVRDRGIPSRIISLASGFYAPLHREMMLKDGEITQLPVESWGNLEFRHGPRSWADETTLIHMIPGTLTRAWDVRVAEELISYGCPLLYYGGDAPEGAMCADPAAPRETTAEVLAAAAFHTAVAAEIGLARGTSPERLRHVVHNVGNL